MRHRKLRDKLNRTGSHRDAMLANMTCSLIEYGRIRTTITKAKLCKRFAEKLITKAKQGTLHANRQVFSSLRSKEGTDRLMKVVAPLYKDRQGGYTRIMRVGNRQGDNAMMVVFELVDGPYFSVKDNTPEEAEVEAPATEEEMAEA